eukprot:jgi/Psemu1/25142/gm1.25142_g
MSCDTCANLQDAEVRREQKKEADLGNRLQPHSKVKMSVLSPFSQWQRAQGLVHRQKIWTQKVQRMKLDVCEAKEEQMVAINSDEAKSLLQAAFGCIGSQEKKSEFKQSVLEVLMNADKHKNFQDKMDGNEISLFTSRICEMLDVESHKLSGNDKQVRYDYRIKRLALAYFLDYGKSGYNRLKESSLEILPIIRTNKRELSNLRGGDGAHAVHFSAQFADALQGRKEPVKGEMFVQIIFDEIKVRCSVAYNPITGKETGFTASKNGTTLSFAEEILSIVEDNLSGEEATTTIEKNKDPYFEPATYANVFRARTARNQTFNVAYFFNSGSLDGDDVLRQLLHVIAALEFVGFKVVMQMSDAGGANTSALALLASNNKNMLAYRLLVNDGKLISWKEVIALYHHLKENCEYSINVHELKGLRRSVAYPDQFTQQNVNDAKKAFEEETISYQCQWLANKIGCTPDFFDKLLEEFQNKDGCGDEILEGKLLEKGMIGSNVKASTRLASSSLYSSHHSIRENCNLYKSEFDLTAGPKQREKWVKDLMEERRAISMSTDISEIQKVSIFPPDMMIDDKMKSWLNIIGKAENGSSYSKVLMDNDAFKDYTAASMLTQGIKEWFKKIILGQADVMFDSLCQKINLQLLKFLVETAEERKRTRSKRAAIGISFHMKLFKMLQHRNMNGVISGTTSDEERRGIASIVLILNEEMKKKRRKGLVKYAESKMAKEQGKKKHLDVRDVNKILGWAIFHLRLKKIRIINSIEEEESENGLQLRKEIDFLSSMRFYTEEALQSQAHLLDKCYDSFLRSSNRGRLTLELVNDPDATANAKDDILKNDELLEVFLDCSKGNVYLGKLSEKKKIFAELVDKVINARFSEEIRAYREEHTARGTKYKGTNLTMREEIDVIGSRTRASSNSDAGRSIEERKEE